MGRGEEAASPGRGRGTGGGRVRNNILCDTLTPVTSFKYLGRALLAAYDDWPAVVSNLWIAWRKWERLTKVLRREGADSQTLGHIYLVVVQSAVLYRSETWGVTPLIGRVLGRFHHRATRRLTGRQPWRGRYSVWIYPPLEALMVEAELQEVDTYVSRRQKTVTQFIVTRPIMDLCLVAERRPGSRVTK